MMSNETFALLTPIAILVAVVGTGGLLYWDIVRRHPAKKKRSGVSPVGASHHSEPGQRTTVPGVDVLENEELNPLLAARLQENAAATARIVREANQLALSVERFTKAITRAK
jgi:hypothetical protein